MTRKSVNGPPPDAIQRAVRSVVMKPPAIAAEMGIPSGGSRPARLRARHHTIARMVAANLPQAQICRAMGLTWSTLESLEQTPAFQELVAKYRDLPPMPEYEGYIDILERCMIAAELEIADRVLEEPEKFSISDLHRVSRDAADRLGYSKHSVNIQVNATLGERLEGLRRRSRTPAGAGDGGGVLSPAAPGSAPPLLDLKAEPAVPIQDSAVSPKPRPQVRPPDPKHPLRPAAVTETIMAGRERVVPDAAAFEALRHKMTLPEPTPEPINRFKPDPAPDGRLKRRKL